MKEKDGKRQDELETASRRPLSVVELYLIRHGNAKKLPDESYVTAPLTELGRQQAQRTGEFFQAHALAFDGLYSSPLKRAAETASLIGECLGQSPILRQGLEEMEYRELPLVLSCELVARSGLLNRYFEAHIGKPLRYPMLGRVAQVMLELLVQHPTGRIAVVAHGGVISSILAWYLPRQRRRWWRETVGNCSITRMQVENGSATICEFDYIAHLDALAATAHQRNYTFSAERLS